jgi:hypothetical protein
MRATAHLEAAPRLERAHKSGYVVRLPDGASMPYSVFRQRPGRWAQALPDLELQRRRFEEGFQSGPPSAQQAGRGGRRSVDQQPQAARAPCLVPSAMCDGQVLAADGWVAGFAATWAKGQLVRGSSRSAIGRMCRHGRAAAHTPRWHQPRCSAPVLVAMPCVLSAKVGRSGADAPLSPQPPLAGDRRDQRRARHRPARCVPPPRTLAPGPCTR